MNCGNCGNPLVSGTYICAVCGTQNIPLANVKKSGGNAKWILLSTTISAVLVIGLILFIVSYGNDVPTAGPDNESRISQNSTPPPSNTIVEISPGGALTPAQIFENNKNAIFRIAVFQGNTHVGWGSGFFISPDGIAVTNHHVLDGATSAYIILEDDSEFDITGYYLSDFGNDLAVIQVDGRGESFQFLTMGDSDAVSIGDNVYAVGGPDGNPLTFTNGIISRFATEPLQYDIYTVSGMFQSTATIYGGNSGGPLLNDRGHVIGINSAGYMGRDSQQWAVPISRVVMPSSGAAVNALPIGGGSASQPQWDGYLSRYPYIPDIQSVSSNSILQLAGTAHDIDFALLLDIDEYGVYHFDYVLVYSLRNAHFINDTDAYDILLRENGFQMQDIINAELDHAGLTVYVFFYNPARNISLAYEYFAEHELLYVFIGQGNAYEQLTGNGNQGGGGGNTNTAGYPGYPNVPVADLLYPSAVLTSQGYADDFGAGNFQINGQLFIGGGDYVYIYSLPIRRVDDVDSYTRDLIANGFQMTVEEIDENRGIYAALFHNPREGIFVSSIYYYNDEYWWIVLD